MIFQDNYKCLRFYKEARVDMILRQLIMTYANSRVWRWHTWNAQRQFWFSNTDDLNENAIPFNREWMTQDAKTMTTY